MANKMIDKFNKQFLNLKHKQYKKLPRKKKKAFIKKFGRFDYRILTIYGYRNYMIILAGVNATNTLCGMIDNVIINLDTEFQSVSVKVLSEQRSDIYDILI